MRERRLIRGIVLAVLAWILAACGGGGGGSGGNGGGVESISSVGMLSGFGSLYVNGIEFDTTGASYRVDDADRFDDSACLWVERRCPEQLTAIANHNGPAVSDRRCDVAD